MKTVDKMGLRENTFVIFTSDNGPEGRSDQSGRTRGSTGGLRGRKRDSHEGGIRVPAIVRWPGKIEPGTVSDTPIIGSDIFSTILEIVDVALPVDILGTQHVADRAVPGLKNEAAILGK